MVLKKEGRLFHRKDDKWLIYIPTKLAEDSQFPFNKLEPGESMDVTIVADPELKMLKITGGEREAKSG